MSSPASSTLPGGPQDADGDDRQPDEELYCQRQVALVLISYGVIVTFQADPHFGRVYAAYGGIFIVMALAWGYVMDGFRPDRWDLIGAAVCLIGMLIIFFGPRGAAT